MSDVNIKMWNANKKNNNCYAFAFDHMKVNSTKKLQPGELSHRTPLPDDEYNCHDMISRVLTDNPGVRVIVSNEWPLKPPKNGYHVALYLDNQGSKKDFHFYRQLDNGTWIHKPGSMEVSNVDDSGEKIVDPRLADRDYVNDNDESDGFDYAQFCAIFLVPHSKEKKSNPKHHTLINFAIITITIVCAIILFLIYFD